MSWTAELNLFDKNTYTFKSKFYLLMNLLVSNQSGKDTEVILWMGIFYIQIISGFFSSQVQVFNLENSKSDKILVYFLKITRIKELLYSSYGVYEIVIYWLLIVTIALIIFFLIKCYNCSNMSFYTLSDSILNYMIKIYIYILYNIVLDWTWSNFCFEEDGQFSPHFKESTCELNTVLTIASALLFIITNVVIFFWIQFYTDSLFLTNNPYTKISCNYETYMTVNCLVYSVLLVQVKYLSKEVFLIYNVIVSSVWLYFYFQRCIFYFQLCNILGGLFHVLYCWTSVFFLIFAYIDFNEKGIIYWVSSGWVIYYYFNLKYKFEEKLLLATPYFKITNKYYLLYYIKSILEKINLIDQSQKEKALLTGIIQMHTIECPNPKCWTKNKNKIYLPITNEWSDRSKSMINDRVFLLNFILVITNYFIEQNYYSPQIMINLSLYYLEVIRNYCLSLFFFRKVKEMNWTTQENFSLIRLQHMISKALISKWKIENEPCLNWEDLNVTYYFKYVDLSQKLFDEMNNDINFSLEFWRSFKSAQVEQNKIIDFNKIFHWTDKIRITKIKVERLWNKLFEIYNGCNEWFELYSNYVESINDDDLRKRDLEEIRRKNDNSAELVQQNYYSLLFNKETGIIIANGDKGKEGLIQKTNHEIETIFKFKPEEWKGMNISQLMPKLFAKDHKMFMTRYFEIGEKKMIDKRDMKSFGKDKHNSVMWVRVAVKWFPVINESVFFVALITKDNIDDIILIDNKFNIQGMSSKLMSIFNIDNKLLFMNNEIPFYVICKKFVNFYKIFLYPKKRAHKKAVKLNIISPDNITLSDNTLLNDTNIKELQNMEQTNVPASNNDNNNHDEDEGEEVNENIEINENIELKYEIKIPQYIYTFASWLYKKEKNLDTKLTTLSNTEIHGTEINEKIDIDEYSESDLLVNDNETPNDNNTKKNKNSNNNNITNTGEMETNKPKPKRLSSNACPGGNPEDFNKQWDEENEFNMNINKSREFFSKAKFTELEDFIDENNKEGNINEYKFNFTFDRYKYGNHQFAYIVRCIDNKMEGYNSDGDSMQEEKDEKAIRVKKEKNEGLKLWYELFDNEKTDLIVKKDSFIQLSLENSEFQKWWNGYKQEIIDTSIVHGSKKEEIAEDENSSQMSQGSFNDNLCKKNHVEEIRANIMLNVSNFFTLKYIKIDLSWVFFATCIFIVILVWFIIDINDTLKQVSSVNTKLFQTSLWMCNLISSWISMRALRTFCKENGIDKEGFNTYIDGYQNYFDHWSEMSQGWYDKTIENFGDVEYHIGEFIDNTVNSFWNKQSVLYNFDKSLNYDIYDSESFPLALNQILSDVNSLLKNPKFNLDKLDEDEDEFIKSTSFWSIENTYENLFPHHFQKLKDIPIKFKNYNSNSWTKIILVICIYFVFVFLLNMVYSFLLYITNKNMGEGLTKVSKIKLEKIEETIKRIELFADMVKNYREKENNTTGLTEKVKTQTEATNPGINSYNLNHNINYSWDSKQHKKLNILNYSYLQTLLFLIILCSFLIPMIILSQEMVTSTNKLIEVQAYMFGKLLIASASTVKVKCMMSECEITSELEYDWVNKSNIQSIVQSISIFQTWDNFYNNEFLLNACNSAFNESSPEYESCMKDVLIQSANNTDSLWKWIDETVDGIYKEKEIKEHDDNYKKSSLFFSSNFHDLESTLYNYITPVGDNLDNIITLSWDEFLGVKIIIITILIVLLTLSILALTIYISVFVVNQLVHLLSVSRCILKIIPTNVITSTQELESWIESKY